MTSVMASAAEERAARHARGGSGNGDPGAGLEPLALEAVASPAWPSTLDVAHVLEAAVAHQPGLAPWTLLVADLGRARQDLLVRLGFVTLRPGLGLIR